MTKKMSQHCATYYFPMCMTYTHLFSLLIDYYVTLLEIVKKII